MKNKYEIEKELLIFTETNYNFIDNKTYVKIFDMIKIELSQEF